MSKGILLIDDIHTYYGDAHILDGVSFEVAKGTCVAVLGRNGVGKTTLARSIIGFTPPTRGHIIFLGKQIAGLPARLIVKQGVAIVPQGRRVFHSLSVEENLRIATKRGPIEPDELVWDLPRVYDLFPRLDERRAQSANTLSGGEQQMLAIGRALMTRPKLLILDEPTEGLAPIIIELVMKALKDLRKAGVSLLLLEQRLAVALDIADVAIAMGSHGAIFFNGPPKQFPIDSIVSAAASRQAARM